ncbi:MAG: hypothetical protein ACI9P5_003595 [Saprospiraceae bacterium]|jgi:hypothetical protein|tara:strand:- start:2045 stop:2179 length:135 start_codon:yes stop_codon:yes gene_type:complete
MILLIGSEDLAFSSKATTKVILENSNAELQIIILASQNGVKQNT